MSRHLVEWLLQHPVELPPVPNVGPDRAWRVLMHLADRTHEQTGLMYASDRDQERCSGLNRRAVIQPVRTALEQAGWLVPTGRRRARGVREYTLQVPGYTYPLTDTHLVSGSAHLATETDQDRPSGSVSGSVSGSGSGSAGLARTEPNGTTPLPPKTNPEPRQVGGRHKGDRVREIVRACEQVRRSTFTGQDKGGLAAYWAKKDRPNAVQALRAHPGADLDTLVRETLALDDTYTGPTTGPQTAPRAPEGPQAVPDCPDCSGTGLVRGDWDDTTRDYGPTRWCPCTQQHTPEKVSPYRDAYTDNQGPGAQADPQSVPLVHDLATKLRRVV